MSFSRSDHPSVFVGVGGLLDRSLAVDVFGEHVEAVEGGSCGDGFLLVEVLSEESCAFIVRDVFYEVGFGSNTFVLDDGVSIGKLEWGCVDAASVKVVSIF